VVGKLEKKTENEKETLYLFGLCSPAAGLLFLFSRLG
jgi:hypothetical protein